MHSSLDELLRQRIWQICQAGNMMPSYDSEASRVGFLVNNVQEGGVWK
jgi:hypothetical protein